jgi:hypothetical protein
MGDGGISINSWQSVENLILRPPRSDSYTRDDLLGGPDGEFAVVGVDGASLPCFRMDVEARAAGGRAARSVTRAQTLGLLRALRALATPPTRAAAPLRRLLRQTHVLTRCARACS